MLFSSVSAAFVVAAAALLNSDNAVLSEAREVSRSLWNNWRAAQAVVSGTGWKPAPQRPTCPYCAGGPCPVCHGAHCAYDEACGGEGTIVPVPSPFSETLTSAVNSAFSTVDEAVDRIKALALDAFLAQRAARSIADATPDVAMGCQFLPGCDFGWTAAPDPLPLARRAPEPPDEAEAPPPAPVEAAVASRFETYLADEPLAPSPLAPSPLVPKPLVPKLQLGNDAAFRPILYTAAQFLQHVADAANAASGRLYEIAGDEPPDDAK